MKLSSVFSFPRAAAGVSAAECIPRSNTSAGDRGINDWRGSILFEAYPSEGRGKGNVFVLRSNSQGLISRKTFFFPSSHRTYQKVRQRASSSSQEDKTHSIRLIPTKRYHAACSAKHMKYAKYTKRTAWFRLLFSASRGLLICLSTSAAA
jgi:hypothetical protein